MATHHTPSGLLLELRLTAGRCEIETADTDETVVETEPTNGSAASRAAAEALEETLSERSQGGHKLVVAMPKLRRLVPLGDAKVLVRIRAPHGAELDAGTAFEPRAQGPIAEEGQRARAEALESLGEANDVLALAQRAEAEEVRSAFRRGLDPEAFEVEAGVDHLRLAARLGHLELELAPEVVRDGDHCRRATDRQAGERPDPRDRTHVAHVAAVGGDDERRASGQRRGQAGRNEEVRVDDVGPDTACRAERAGREGRVAALPAGAAVEHGPLELVPALAQGALELRHEHAEIGVVGPRVHLRDEQDAH